MFPTCGEHSLYNCITRDKSPAVAIQHAIKVTAGLNYTIYQT